MTNNQYFHPLRPKYSCERHDENCQHPTLTLPHFLARPSSASCTPSGCSDGFGLGRRGCCHSDQFLIRSPACSVQKKNSPHRSPWKHTSCESSSPPGPLPHPGPFRVGLPRHPTSRDLTSPPMFLSHPHIRPSCTCLCVCVCVVFTGVCVSVISRTRKAEFPSSLWHVTAKSP